jgi:uncharacterized protein (DUF736 family)
MTEQPKKDNRGYLYPNGNKTKPTHPDHTGTLMADGKEWRLAAWENQSTDGKKYFSIIISPPLTNTEQFKKTNEPQAAIETSEQNNTVQHPSSGNDMNTNNANSDYYNQSIAIDELDDLDAILKSSDDDNPFN